MLWLSVVTGFVFWSLFFGFGPMIWFYPLNELDITGYEAFVLILLFPLLFLDLGFVRSFLSSFWGNLLLECGCISGILSFQAPSTLSRLCLIVFGSACALMKFTLDLSCGNELRRKCSFWGYTFGFFALLVSRIFYNSINPTWNDHVSNAAVAAMSIGASLSSAFLIQEISFSPTSEQTYSSPTKRKPLHAIKINCVPLGLGFGSLLYLIHSVFAEVSVVSRWVVTGYPNSGPAPMPYGIGVLGSLLLGIYVSKFPRIAFQRTLSIAGALGICALYKLPGWPGYAGGLVLGVYAGSTWPTLLNLVGQSEEKSGRVVFLAVLTYLVEIFYAVWTVAYNFVPGGTYTREFTGLNIGVIMVTMGLSLESHKFHPVVSADNNIGYTISGMCSKVWPWKTVKKCLVLVFILGSVGMAQRYVRYKPQNGRVRTSEVGDPILTPMVWTYHFAYDNQGWPSLDRSSKLMTDLEADIIGLLETDASKAFMGNNDLAGWLGEKLQMFVDFGPSTKDHTWGNILLSRYPIKNSTHYLLPSPHGELAPALTAILDVQGKEVGVILTHMGNDRDDLDRKLQTETLAKLAVKFENQGIPVIFLGYITSRPFSRDYNVFTERGKLKDIDSTDSDRFCEYILYNGLTRLGYARISHGGLTDTEVQAARFRLEEKFQKHGKNKRIITGDQSENILNLVEKSVVFSPVFGEFFRGHYSPWKHHYHMDTPKYFTEK